jgi:hypothetical protein
MIPSIGAWPFSSMYHSVSDAWQAQQNTSIQDIWYINFNYSSLSSCTDHGSDSVSDSTASGSRSPSQNDSTEMLNCFPFPFHEFGMVSALIDGPSDCTVEMPKMTFFRRGGGPA